MKTLQERLKEYGRQCLAAPDETKLQEMVWCAQDAFWKEAEKYPASSFEFFCRQAGYVRKRWWGLQFLVLTLLWGSIHSFSGERTLQKMMGIAAALFAILIIPELWKNKESNAMEVESSTFYSLRQIYAVRMLAFGLVDTGLLRVITVAVSMTTSLRAKEMIVYFFLPFTVTCCIMFRALYSRTITQIGAVFLPLFWMAIWLYAVMNERVYQRISNPVWGCALLLTMLYLVYAVKKALAVCENFAKVGM